MAAAELRRAYDELTLEGTRLAGRLTQLSQRATVYHHLYRASGGNHVFPLIASHGALWAGDYFRTGLKLGRVLVWQYVLSAQKRHELLRQLDDFADAFREVNRLVCVDTYRNFHFTARYGRHAGADELVPRPVLDVLNRVHQAREAGNQLSEDEKREVFLAHFMNEQATVVTPRIQAAVAALEWPLLKWLALQPTIRFTYFAGQPPLRFRDFSQTSERIEKGLRAFEAGSTLGWSAVERALRDYAIPTAEVGNGVLI